TPTCPACPEGCACTPATTTAIFTPAACRCSSATTRRRPSTRPGPRRDFWLPCWPRNSGEPTDGPRISGGRFSGSGNATPMNIQFVGDPEPTLERLASGALDDPAHFE